MTSIRITTTRYSFQVVREAEPAYPAGATLGSPPDAVAIARHVIGSEIAEVLLVLLLDSRHRVTGFAEVARGTVNANRFSPRDVLIPALASNAAAVVVCHNHPSGDPSPSPADRRVTTALREACDIIGIRLLDHLIVTDTGHHSFREADGWED
jgi:DNA repair protein RadC